MRHVTDRKTAPTRTPHRCRAGAALLAGALLATACGDRQSASDTGRAARVAALIPVSGPSPFAPQGCAQPDIPVYEVLPPEIDGENNDGQEFGDESDLSIAVNPANSRHWVAAWVQDSGLGIMVGVSLDGGLSWRRATVPDLSFCLESSEERVLHARTAFGPDGLVYLTAEAQDGWFPDPRTAASQRIPAGVSRDGGLTWTTATINGGISDGGIKGLSTLAAEPDLAGAALVAWHNEPATVTTGTYLARTTDGGGTWERLTVRLGEPGNLPFNRILPLADGSWLVFDADLPSSAVPGAIGLPIGGGGTPVRVRRTADKGATWSEPVTIAEGAVPQWVAAAQAPDGAIYVGWLARDGEGAITQFVARSDDGGSNWSAPVATATAPDHLHPALAVAGDGTVGFAYTDHRRDDPSDTAVQRDVWFAYSSDRGQTWQELHIAGPFELHSVDLGFYQETIGLPDGFAAAVLLGKPFAIDGRTDVFVSRVATR